MRSLFLPIVLISLTLGPIQAAAGPAHRTPGYYDQAKVVEVVPIREVVRLSTPHQECWTEEVEHVRHYDDDGVATVAGSILGGVVGHQFGGGSGRQVATVAGSVLGAVIGHDVGRGYDRTYTTMERRCQTVNDYHERERIVGYRVTYDYDGRTYTTDMDRHPGRYVRVRVSVAAVE
jgi:uncharacterized protein YcfJ